MFWRIFLYFVEAAQVTPTMIQGHPVVYMVNRLDIALMLLLPPLNPRQKKKTALSLA